MQGSVHHKWVGLFLSLMSKRGKVLVAEASSPGPVWDRPARCPAGRSLVPQAATRRTLSGTTCLLLWPCGTGVTHRAPASHMGVTVLELFPGPLGHPCPPAPGSRLGWPIQVRSSPEDFSSSRWNDWELVSLTSPVNAEDGRGELNDLK